MIANFFRRPGILPESTAAYRMVSRDGNLGFLPRGGIIDASKSRDPGNTSLITTLRPGLLMGKITASGYWAPSIIGVTQGAYTSGGTSLTLTAAQATELVRRVGSSGTFKLVGPATAAGANNTTTVTYSAVNTGTGVVTITDIGANRIAGCLVSPSDGSETIMSMIPDGTGLPIHAIDLANIEFPQIPVSGIIDSAQLLPVWPSDTTLRTYIRESLSTLSGGKFVFSDRY